MLDPLSPSFIFCLPDALIIVSPCLNGLVIIEDEALLLQPRCCLWTGNTLEAPSSGG